MGESVLLSVGAGSLISMRRFRINNFHQTAYTLKFFAQAFCFKKLVAPEPAHSGKHTAFTDQTN
jgi:hypothetical protein